MNKKTLIQQYSEHKLHRTILHHPILSGHQNDMRYTAPFIAIFPSVLLGSPTSSITEIHELENLLVPNDKGELVDATPSQVAAHSARFVNETITKRDACSDGSYTGAEDINQPCHQYCERSVTTVTGDPVKGQYFDCSGVKHTWS